MRIDKIIVAVFGLNAVIMGGCASRSAAVKDENMAHLASGNSAPRITSQDTGQSGRSTEKASDMDVELASPVDKNRIGSRDNILSPYPQKIRSRNQDSSNAEPVPTSKTATKLESHLATIHFDFDSYALTNNARELLQKNAAILKNNCNVKIRIEGNCDERGSDEYNLALGEKRAKTAMQYLVTLGIEPNRVTVISYGREKPFETGHNDIAWALNRRDDFVVIGK